MLRITQSDDRNVQPATTLLSSQHRNVEQLKRDVKRDVIRDVNKMRNLIQRDGDQLRRALTRDVNEIRNLLHDEMEQFKRDVKHEITEMREMLHRDAQLLKHDAIELREMQDADFDAPRTSHDFTCSGIVFVLLMFLPEQPRTLHCSLAHGVAVCLRNNYKIR